MYRRLRRNLFIAAGAVLAVILLWAGGALAQKPADPIGPAFRQAQELIRAGRFEQAAPILEWILRTRPELVRVQLDYALVLFRLGRDAEAREIFLAIRRKPDLPAPVQRNVEDFLERIRDREPLQFGFDFGLWRDGNINNASEAETVDIPIFGTTLPFRLNERPKEAWVARTGANLRWRTPVSPQTHLEVRTAAARDTAIGEPDFNRTHVSVSVGPRIRYFLGGAGKPLLFGQVNVDVGAQRHWRGGDAYSTTGWLGLGVDQAIAPNWRIGVQASYWKTAYDEGADAVEPTGISYYAGVSRRIGPGWLTVGGKMSQEMAKRENSRWKGREASVSYGATLWRDFNFSVRASLGDREYEGKEALVQERRSDDIYSINGRLSHRALSFEGFLPVLNLGWSRTDSSIVLHDRTVRTARLGLRRLF